MKNLSPTSWCWNLLPPRAISWARVGPAWSVVTNIVDIPPFTEKPKPSLPSNPPNEWMKNQSESDCPTLQQGQSLFLFSNDNDKNHAGHTNDGTPLEKQQFMDLPPVVNLHMNRRDRPQYQPRGDNNQYKPVCGEKRTYLSIIRCHPPRIPRGRRFTRLQQWGQACQPTVPKAECIACVPLVRIAIR